jgi:hypothetical protein
MAGTGRPMQDNALDVARARTPWASAGMVPEVNVFGEEVKHSMRGGDRTEPEYKLLQEVPVPVPNRKIMGQDISKEDFYELSTRLGQGRKIMYQALAADEGFMSLSQGEKELIIGAMLPKIDAAVMNEVKAVSKIADPLYSNKKARTLLQLQKPNTDVGIFPFSRPTK